MPPSQHDPSPRLSLDAPVSITPRSDKNLSIGLAILTFAIPFLLFLGTSRYALLQWDDDIEISGNTHIRALSFENIRWMFTDISYVRRYIPLDWLSWAVNYQVARIVSGDGLNPTTYHLGNVLYHCSIAVVFFFILRRLMAVLAGGESRTTLLASAFGAGFWAIHPLRVEAVAWANSRIHQQALLFVALSYLCYLKAFDSTRGGRSSRWLLGVSLVFYFLSLLSYGTTLGYVVVLIATDMVVLRRLRWRGLKQMLQRQNLWVLLEKVPFVGAAAVYLGVTLWASFNAAGIWSKPVTLAEFSLFARIMQAAYLVAYYLWKPFGSFQLSPVYTTLVHFSPMSLPFIASLIADLGICVIVWVLRKRAPLLMALWVCHLALLFPMLGWTEHPHYPSDRYSYIQGMLWSVLLAAAVVVAWQRELVPKFTLIGISAAMLIGVGAVTWQQNRVWRDSETLFQYMIAELGDDPYRADIQRRLGRYYVDQGRISDALDILNQSLVQFPLNPIARSIKGDALIRLAMQKQQEGGASAAIDSAFVEAAENFDQGGVVNQLRELQPTVESLTSAAFAYARGHRFQDAESRLKVAMALAPPQPEPVLRLGQLLYEEGKQQEALELLNSAIQLAPQISSQRDAIVKQWQNPPIPWVTSAVATTTSTSRPAP